MRVDVYQRLQDLPDSHIRLLDESCESGYYGSVPWFENFAATAANPGDQLCIFAVMDSGSEHQPILILPARMSRNGGALGVGLEGLTNAYSCQYAPALADSGRSEAAINAVARHIWSAMPKLDYLRIDSVALESTLLGVLRRGLSTTGFLIQPFFHFGNWYVDTSGKRFADYWKHRPSQLRHTVSRKQRKLDVFGEVTFRLFSSTAEMDVAVADYEQVYARSWKQAEPYPEFIPGLMRATARSGSLRTGVLYLDARPVAAQIWIVSGGEATIFKLAHDEALADYSVGSICTFLTMRAVIDGDCPEEVDFGRGDDPYKQHWLPCRRERWGLLAFNPRTVRGFAGAVRHVGAYHLKRMLGRDPAPVIINNHN